jgi:hypothetical protein
LGGAAACAASYGLKFWQRRNSGNRTPLCRLDELGNHFLNPRFSLVSAGIAARLPKEPVDRPQSFTETFAYGLPHLG